MDSTNNKNTIDSTEHIVRRTRVALIIVLYTLFFDNVNAHIDPNEIDYTAILEAANVGKIKEKRFTLALKEILSQLSDIDAIITKYAPKRPLPEIDRVVLSILRVAIYEGFIGKTVPPKVSINEALEIAKELVNLKQTQFISGILGTIFSEYKTD